MQVDCIINYNDEEVKKAARLDILDEFRALNWKEIKKDLSYFNLWECP